MDEYRTLRETAQDEFTEKRSRFIGYVGPVTSEREALDFISEIKSKHWDAKHNVYAYCLREGNVCRYSDDGEPSGTAGMPVLGVIQKSGLTDCAVVVTRRRQNVLISCSVQYSPGLSSIIAAAISPSRLSWSPITATSRILGLEERKSSICTG